MVPRLTRSAQRSRLNPEIALSSKGSRFGRGEAATEARPVPLRWLHHAARPGFGPISERGGDGSPSLRLYGRRERIELSPQISCRSPGILHTTLKSQLRIISGGQTGADRATLDWAIDHQVPHEAGVRKVAVQTMVRG